MGNQYGRCLDTRHTGENLPTPLFGKEGNPTHLDGRGRIGSGAEDFASAPSHTTGHTVFGIRRLESCGFLRKIQRSPEALTTSSIRSSSIASFPAHALTSTTREPPVRLSGLHP